MFEMSMKENNELREFTTLERQMFYENVSNILINSTQYLILFILGIETSFNGFVYTGKLKLLLKPKPCFRKNQEFQFLIIII